MVYNNVDALPVGLKVALALGFIALIGALAWSARKYRLSTILLAAYCLAGPLLVVALSFKRPIYIDRYFVFAAVAFYCLLAVIYALSWPFAKRPRLQTAAIALTLVAFGWGIHRVSVSNTHEMRKIGEVVSSQYQTGDQILSGELYTFFDFSYYNRTGEPVKLWSKRGVNGFGESSLIYDRASQIVVRNLEDLQPFSGHIWVVGKTGKKDYYDQTPAGWRTVGPRYEYGYSAVQKYYVPPKR